ncbi:tryptophan RNA-binding attenuation protein [Paenibacillus sp. MBLB4367]|uniref:tryptophan RNA-binding attenuation protein n=1 Tax=Paenibacillus sp. MBLB4367 TaxID=3384767 RepID=UPI0039081B57
MIAMDDLEITCPECKGSGEAEGIPCKKCDSKGVILTSLGQTLLHFINKHIKH